MNRDDYEAVAARALAEGECTWAVVARALAVALGLPDRIGGWGLLMFQPPMGETPVTAACERAHTVALYARARGVTDWTDRVELWASGTPFGTRMRWERP